MDEHIIGEFKVTSKDVEECVDPTISQNYRGEKGGCLSPKLIGWCRRQRSTEMRVRPTS